MLDDAATTDGSHPANVFQVTAFDPDHLAQMEQITAQLSVCNHLFAVMEIACKDDVCGGLATHARSIMSIWGEMICDCTEDTESNPFVREGIPNRGIQLVMAQQGAIYSTIRILKLVLQVPYSEITDQNSNKAITLLFRFLKQMVKDNHRRSHVTKLEVHLKFLYEHLDSEYRVVDTIAELFTDNPRLLEQEVLTCCFVVKV